MKKFKFRLQKVLDVRRIRERQQEEKLQVAIHKRQEEEKRLGLLEKELRDIQQAMLASRQIVFEAWAHTADTQYHTRLVETRNTQMGRIREVAQNEQAIRQEFIETRRNTRVMEKLRELRYDDWKRDVSRWEDKLLDENSNHAHNLRKVIS